MTSIFLKLAHYYYLSVVASLVEDLKAKHPNLTDEIELLTNADPSRSHKYLRYGVKQLLAGQKLTDILETIKLFHTLSSKLPHLGQRICASLRSNTDKPLAVC